MFTHEDTHYQFYLDRDISTPFKPYCVAASLLLHAVGSTQHFDSAFNAVASPQKTLCSYFGAALQHELVLRFVLRVGVVKSRDATPNHVVPLDSYVRVPTMYSLGTFSIGVCVC